MKQNDIQAKSSAWKVLSVVSFIFSGISLFMGFFKMFVYENGDYYPYDTVNAYVGGDAYNYIINGTYATAFFVLAGTFLLAAIGLMILHYVCLGTSTKHSALPEVAVLEDIESNLPQI